MSFITAIGTANPPHRFKQAEIEDFMLNTMQLNNGDSRKLKAIFRASGIAFRHSVIEDYGLTQSQFKFFPTTSASLVPGTKARLEFFRRHAVELSIASVRDMLDRFPAHTLNQVTHLISVCCTGMFAPGLDVELVRQLNLKSSVDRTAINFMGCHAAVNALKVADAVCRSDDSAKVLIVCTELCSLHFQQTASDDNFLANALFGDGSASLIVEPKASTALNLKLQGFYSELADEGIEDMAWTIGDRGFEMKLSAYVPSLIKKGIAGLASKLLAKLSSTMGIVKHFAIHPGGKKILEAIESELPLTKEDNSAAYHVLRNYGNMSSPTILFVLKELIDRLSPQNYGEHILSFAFGPGLTMEGMLLAYEKPSHA